MRRVDVLLLLAVAASCSGRTGAGEEDTTAGATSCEAYKRSYCAYGSQCNLLSAAEEECLEELEPVVCRSDRLARDCHEALDSLSCLDTPPACDPVDVADPTAARNACESVSDALCRQQEACFADYSYDLCRADTAMTLPCDFVFVVTRDPAPCLQALRGASCDAATAAECDGLFAADG